MKTPPSVELVLIKLLLKYSSYKEYSRYVKIPAAMKEIKMLYHTLDALHTQHPDVDKTPDELSSMVFISYPSMREPERKLILDLIERLSSINVSEDVLQDLVDSIRVRAETHTLALKALEVSEGRDSLESLREIFKRIDQPVQSITTYEKNFITDDLFELEKHTIMGEGLRWRLNCLNLSLGPLRVGDFGFIFARPESGKTTFLADQCTHMAGQTNKPIIWFNNEEQGQKVRLRMYQAALGIRADELWADKQRVMDQYREVTKGNLQLYDDKAIHRKDVELIIEAKQPALVIFDQIDKIEGFQADRPDLVYGRIYQWARELAKNQCAIIGVCQADGHGEGVQWLTMNHVSEAKTRKQAEADWILGIGKSNEVNTESVRFLNISKNKLLGDNECDPNLRHGRFEVFIKPQVARYEDIEYTNLED